MIHQLKRFLNNNPLSQSYVTLPFPVMFLIMHYPSSESLRVTPTAHFSLPIHIRLCLPVKSLRIARGIKRELGGFIWHIHLRQAIGSGCLSEQLHLAASLHQRVQVARLVHRAADGQQTVVPQYQALAFWSEGFGEALAFFF
jgi:hypothetical protein